MLVFHYFPLQLKAHSSKLIAQSSSLKAHSPKLIAQSSSLIDQSSKLIAQKKPIFVLSILKTKNIMKIVRRASAIWKGTGKEGTGTVSTQSTVLNNTQYSYGSRFEEGVGTNPEELVGAALAGCYSMKLSFLIVAAGFVADSISTSAKVTLDEGKIGLIDLEVTAKVPGMNAAQFDEAAKAAKESCPISKSLTAEITLNAKLEG